APRGDSDQLHGVAGGPRRCRLPGGAVMTRARWMPLALAFGLAAAARAQTAPGGSAQEAGRPGPQGAPARRPPLGPAGASVVRTFKSPFFVSGDISGARRACRDR